MEKGLHLAEERAARLGRQWQALEEQLRREQKKQDTDHQRRTLALREQRRQLQEEFDRGAAELDDRQSSPDSAATPPLPSTAATSD